MGIRPTARFPSLRIWGTILGHTRSWGSRIRVILQGLRSVLKSSLRLQSSLAAPSSPLILARTCKPGRFGIARIAPPRKRPGQTGESEFRAALQPNRRSVRLQPPGGAAALLTSSRRLAEKQTKRRRLLAPAIRPAPPAHTASGFALFHLAYEQTTCELARSPVRLVTRFQYSCYRVV